MCLSLVSYSVRFDHCASFFIHKVSDDALKVPVKASSAPPSVGGDVHSGGLNGDSEASGTAADDAIVGSLVGTGEAESVGRGGESTSATVPSAEEGLNLWDPEEGREATAPRDVTSMQVPYYTSVAAVTTKS